jgi:aspartate/methionine/tyrosine aminotransferase
MLSQRARKQVPRSTLNKMWDVMRDLWTKHDNPQGPVDLGVAKNKLMQVELKHYPDNNVTLHGSVISYQDGPTGNQRLRQALARFLNRQLETHRPLEASHIIVTNGVSSALEHSAWDLADEGEAFLLGRPYHG